MVKKDLIITKGNGGSIPQKKAGVPKRRSELSGTHGKSVSIKRNIKKINKKIDYIVPGGDYFINVGKQLDAPTHMDQQVGDLNIVNDDNIDIVLTKEKIVVNIGLRQ